MALRLSADLQPLGTPFQVSDSSGYSGAHQMPTISVAPGGEFTIAWSQSASHSEVPALYARRFDASGSPIGEPFTVHEGDGAAQYTPRVAMDTDGDTAFAWTQLSADGSRIEAMLRRYRGNAEVDLGIESTVEGLQSHPGGAVQVQLSGRNLADSPDAGGEFGEGFATGMGIAIELPPGSQLLEAFGGGWTCSSDGTLQCASRIALEGGGVVPTLELHLLAPEAPGNYAIQAALVADQRDPAPANNTVDIPLLVAVPTPDPFGFEARLGVVRGSTQVSEAAALSGFAGSLPVAVAYGEFSVNGAAFTTTPTHVLAGDSVRVRHTASSGFDTTVTSVLYVGDYAAQFATTTESIDTLPDAFDFVDVANAPRKRDIHSNVVTITGVNADTPISISGGGASYSRNGGAYTTVAGVVRNGDTVRLRMRSANSPNTTSTTSVSIGGVVDVWRVTTGR